MVERKTLLNQKGYTMRTKIALVLIVLAMAFAPKAHSQAAPTFAGQTNGNLTGSIWSEIGTISPVEKGNVIFATGVTEGFDFANKGIFIFTPFAAAQSSLDSYGYDWDNTIAASLGLKTSIRLSHGVLSASAGYGVEDRWKSGMFASSPEVYLEDWFGWQIPAKYKRFPGSTWTTFGMTSPIEKYNLILYGHLQQGVTVARLGKVAQRPIVIFGEGTLVKDTQRHDWDNLIRAGVGAEITVGHGISIGANFTDEHRNISGLHADGLGLFIKFDSQWGKE